MEMLPGRSEIYVLGDEDRQLAVGGPALIAPDGSRHEVPVRVFEALQLVEATLRSGLPVKLADVLAFRQRLQAQRRDALTEMLDEQPWDDDGDGDDTAPSPNPGR